MTCVPTRHAAAVLASVKAKPSRWPPASPDPACGRRRSATVGSRPFQDQIPTKSSLYGFRGLPPRPERHPRRSGTLPPENHPPRTPKIDKNRDQNES
jgi:hypothetical protein